MYDATHTELWSLDLDGFAPHEIIQHDGDFIVVGSTFYPELELLELTYPRVARVSAEGELLWEVTLPATPEYPFASLYAVTTTPDARLLVGGTRSEGDGTFSGTTPHPWVAQLYD